MLHSVTAIPTKTGFRIYHFLCARGRVREIMQHVSIPNQERTENEPVGRTRRERVGIIRKADDSGSGANARNLVSILDFTAEELRYARRRRIYLAGAYRGGFILPEGGGGGFI